MKIRTSGPGGSERGRDQNSQIRKSMEHAVGIAIDQAKSGANYNRAMAKDAYENGVDSGEIDIFWEDYNKLCRLAHQIFIDNGGEF